MEKRNSHPRRAARRSLALVFAASLGVQPSLEAAPPTLPRTSAQQTGVSHLPHAEIGISWVNLQDRAARHPRHGKQTPKPCARLEEISFPEIVPASASMRLTPQGLPAPPRHIAASEVELLPTPDDTGEVPHPASPTTRIVLQGGQGFAEAEPMDVPPLPPEPSSSTPTYEAALPSTISDSPMPVESWPTNPNFIPWEIFAQGEYIGPPRTPHVPEYRVRVDDALLFVYRLTRETMNAPYRLKVGDVLKVESITSEPLNQTITVEPDGMITLPIAGRLPAAGRTLDELTRDIENLVAPQVRDPAISILPELLDQRLEELRATVDNRSAAGGQSFEAIVTPDGSIQLPAIGNVNVVGLSLPELNTEIAARYSALFPGVDVTAVLKQRAARYVYVLGEVRSAGRFNLVAPTSAMQALSLAGGHLVGADLTNLIVLRRDENWRLVACRLNLSEDLRGDCINRTHDVWLRDSDILLVPKSHCQRVDEYIDLVLTRGLYGIIPLRYAVSYTRISN